MSAEPEPEFWLVWNPAGRNPHHQHRSAKSASKEARRLAGLNPREDFYVLHAVELHRATQVPVETIVLAPAEPDEEHEIPF